MLVADLRVAQPPAPAAGLIEKGRFGLNLRLFPRGGVLGQIDAGVLKRLSIGLSYGGVDVIGDDSIDWYPRVEVAARYRFRGWKWPPATASSRRARQCRP